MQVEPGTERRCQAGRLASPARQRIQLRRRLLERRTRREPSHPLDRTALDPATIDDTLGVVLKAREDIEAMKGERLQGLLARAMLQGVRRSG